MNKNWLMTGSSRWFCRRFAEEILSRGDRIVAAVSAPEQLTLWAESHRGRIRLVRMENSSLESAENTVKAAGEILGRIDVLLNYVDPELERILEERGEAEFRRKVDRRFWSMIHASRAVVPLMREQGEGRILQVFCQEQAEEAEPCRPLCEAFHGAMGAFNEALAHQVAGYGIRVEVLSPEELGMVEEALVLVR